MVKWMARPPQILVLGYGNPTRADDGLGPAFAARVADLGLPGVLAQSCFQLDIGEAARVADYDLVLFADAVASGPEPFTCTGVVPGSDPGFGTHHTDPGQILDVAGRLYGARTPAYLLGIRGYAFEAFSETLTTHAQENLARAVTFVQQLAAADWHCSPQLLHVRMTEARQAGVK